MKKALFVFSMPEEGAYIGGVASIINSYMSNRDLFYRNGIDIDLYNYVDKLSTRFKNGAIKKVVYGINQAKNLKKTIISDGVEIVHIHTSRNSLFVKDIFLGAYIAQKTNSKLYMTIHVGDISTVFQKIPNPLRKACIQIINKYFFKVFFLTKTIQDQFLAAGVCKDNVAVLYNFCDNFDFPLSKHPDEQIINLLFVGMLNKDKGILELLDAVSNPYIKDRVKLNICGSITDESIKELFNKKLEKIQNIAIHHGYVKGKDKAKVFAESDVLVLPSYHEGFPLVVLEALNSSCAIIATRVGAIPEILNENNCIFVEIGNSKSIENAIIEILNNRLKLKKMQERNKDLSLDFSSDNHITQLCASYNERF